MLQHSLKSRLCFLKTFLKFFDVESTPLISSSEFYARQTDARAVQTLRQSQARLLPTTSRRFPWKLGVLMVRFEISAAMGLSLRGEGAQRQVGMWLKKSGGSFELLILMFLRRAKLWLMLGASISVSSLQNYMLEIQLFDSRRPSQYILLALYPLPYKTPLFWQNMVDVCDSWLLIEGILCRIC